MVKHPHVQELSLSYFCGEDGSSAPALSLMQRPVPWLWITAIALLLLAPGFTARLFVDVLEGFTLLLVFGPLVLAGAGFLAWQWFKSRLVTCAVCGTPSFGASTCPACGAPMAQADSSRSAAVDQPASNAVIDVQVCDISDEP
jgi:hypothetical protein